MSEAEESLRALVRKIMLAGVEVTTTDPPWNEDRYMMLVCNGGSMVLNRAEWYLLFDIMKVPTSEQAIG